MIIINNSRNDYSYAIHMSAGLTHWIPSGRKGMNGQSQGGEHQNGGGGRRKGQPRRGEDGKIKQKETKHQRGNHRGTHEGAKIFRTNMVNSI